MATKMDKYELGFWQHTNKTPGAITAGTLIKMLQKLDPDSPLLYVATGAAAYNPQIEVPLNTERVVLTFLQ